MTECELALKVFSMTKLDCVGHRNTLDLKFEQYKKDVMKTTLHNMVKKGILWECSNKRYQLIPGGALRTLQSALKSPHPV